jgi:hypothetical protein
MEQYRNMRFLLLNTSTLFFGGFPIFWHESTRWRLILKCVQCRTKLDIYGFITITDTAADGLLVPEGMCLVVITAELTGFIGYSHYWHLHFLNYVIIIKTKGLLPRVTLDDVCYHV